MERRPLSRVVTIVVIVLFVAGVVLLIRSKMPDTTVGQEFRVCVLFRDGTRLATGSPVMISGVRVGEVTNLSVDGQFARIDMTLRNRVDIPADSWVTKKAYSPFGDSYIEIIPTSAEQGAAPRVNIRSGECFTRVLEGSSTDTMLRSIARAMDPIDRGLERVHQVTLDGRKWAQGVLEDRILDVDKWIDEGHIDKPLDSANNTLAGWEERTTNARNAVHDAKPDVEKAFDRAEKGVANARKQIVEFRIAMQEGMKNAREGLNRMDKPVEELTEVMAAVNEGRGDDGKGQFGRLVNDPKLGDDLDDTTEGLREGMATFTRFKIWLGFRVEWNWFAAQPRFYLSAEIPARNDKFYLIELEKGPLGAYDFDTLTDSTGQTTWTRRQQITEGLRFTAQFGKRIGFVRFRGGIKESTFGFGADVLMGSRLKLSGDVFGGYQRTPRVKVAAALEVFRSLYVHAGVDDVLTQPGYIPIVKGNTDVPQQFETLRYGRDYFFGASLQFKDADLALLLRAWGAVVLGLILF